MSTKTTTEVFMNNSNQPQTNQLTLPKLQFNWEKIKQISDRHFHIKGLNRSIDYEQLDKNEILIPEKFVIHHFGHLEPRTSHIRVFFRDYISQDMMIEDYFEGDLVLENTNGIIKYIDGIDLGVDIPLELFKQKLIELDLEYQTTDEIIQKGKTLMNEKLKYQLN
tara:strand:+ start:25 stop:519 length:495 start_codon:yes stop_codon:yes gene_type:complete